jgi:hypothetical protein
MRHVLNRPDTDDRLPYGLALKDLIVRPAKKLQPKAIVLELAKASSHLNT